MNGTCFRRIAIILLLVGSATKAQSAEYRASLGFGFQYGPIGLMNSLIFDAHRLRISTLLLSGTLGYDYRFRNNYSIGVQYFYIASLAPPGEGQAVLSGAGPSFNYYFNGYDKSGWMIGLDVLLQGNINDRIVPFISVGYDFVRR